MAWLGVTVCKAPSGADAMKLMVDPVWGPNGLVVADLAVVAVADVLEVLGLLDTISSRFATCFW